MDELRAWKKIYGAGFQEGSYERKRSEGRKWEMRVDGWRRWPLCGSAVTTFRLI